MEVVKYTLFFSLLSFIFNSCIREGEVECPPVNTLTISVLDKNYDNVSDIEGLTPIDENLSFQSYINPLSVLSEREGGTIENKTITPEGNETDYSMAVNSYADGKYMFAIAGSYLFNDVDTDLENVSISLHPDNAESLDTYLGRKEVSLPLYANDTIGLTRTKGKLLLQFVGFPAEITKVDAEVSGVYASVNINGVYSGSTTVYKTFVPGRPDMNSYYSMRLAPTADNTNSSLSLKLYGATGNLITTLSNIEFDIIRNQLTVLQARYNPVEGKWEIYIFLNGQWKGIHNLDIIDE